MREAYWEILASDRASTKTTESQYSPVRLEQARLVSSLLCDAQALVSFRVSKAKKYTARDRFRGNGLWQNSDQERTNQKARTII